MSDVLAGLSRRVKEFEYRRATAPEIARLVRESAEGGDGADAILRLALAEPDESLAEDFDWTYGSASPKGQGAEVGQEADGAARQSPEEMFGAMSSFDMIGLVDPDDGVGDEEDDDEVEEAGDEVEQFDLAEVGDALEKIEEDLAENSNPEPKIGPGEAAEVY